MLWSRTFVGYFLRWRLRKRWIKIPWLPDELVLWRSIQPDYIYRKDGKIKPSYFRDNRGGLSCDIALLSDAESSRRGYANPPAWDQSKAGLAEFTVRSVRTCAPAGGGADVEHHPENTPRLVNYAHAQFTRPLTSDEERSMAKRALVRMSPKIT